MARRKPFLLDVADTLLVAAILALFARTFLFQAFSIPSESMEPGLLVGDKILVNKFVLGERSSGFWARLLPTEPVRRGDVVVFRYPLEPDRNFVKRCLGLPGDTIEIERRQLWVNGESIDESAYTYFDSDDVYPRSVALPEGLRTRDNYGPYTVPDGHYFCMGDNRNQSNDSRVWGAVPRDNFVGRAVAIYWSTTPESVLEDEAGTQEGDELVVADEPVAPSDPPGTEPGRPRWDRVGRLVR